MVESAAEALSQPHLLQAWHPLCTSEELGKAPLRCSLYGAPIVLFRGAEGAVGALVDRCPHRNVPLSFGSVHDGQIACGYHGWRFNRQGHCTQIPGLAAEADAPGRRATAYVAREQQGIVWVWGDLEAQPRGEPFRFRLAEDPRYLTVRKALDAEASVHAVAENALDVPHTAFAHGGLFRVDRDRRPITCRVTRHADHVEAEYVGEQRPKGLAGRLLSPSGGEVVHFDRFHLPGVVEVEYRIGEENHILLNGVLCPVSDHQTRLFAVVSVRTRIPGWLLRPFVEPVALRIFAQDQKILALQTAAMHEFGSPRFVSTEIDLLGPHILRLMRQAERGQGESAAYQREVQMLV